MKKYCLKIRHAIGAALAPLILLAGTQSVHAQGWQQFTLTDFSLPNGVEYAESVVDSSGNIHIYFIASITAYDYPLYYMRVSPYGEILTDTVRINAFIPDALPTNIGVVGDGTGRTWCVWGDRTIATPPQRALYLARRDIEGNEIAPPRLLGRGGGGMSPVANELDVVFRPSDSTLHIFGDVLPYYYYRITLEGDSIIWRQPISEPIIGYSPHLGIAPNGRVWGAVRNSLVGGDTDLLLIRFNEDSTQSVFRPFGSHTGLRWAPYDMTIDSSGNFRILVYCDSANFAYCVLDSNLMLQEWSRLGHDSFFYPALGLDSVGRCMIVWEYTLGFYWALHDSGNTWVQEPQRIGPANGIYSLSVSSASNGRWLVTCPMDEPRQMILSTYGYPPNHTSNRMPLTIANEPRAYPNPFNATTTLSFFLSHTAPVSLTIFNLLGQAIYQADLGMLNAGEYRQLFDASELPSGVYLARVQAGERSQMRKMVLLK